VTPEVEILSYYETYTPSWTNHPTEVTEITTKTVLPSVDILTSHETFTSSGKKETELYTETITITP
jgi:hypothetical protein